MRKLSERERKRERDCGAYRKGLLNSSPRRAYISRKKLKLENMKTKLTKRKKKGKKKEKS
jgi:hypothetical protein